MIPRLKTSYEKEIVAKLMQKLSVKNNISKRSTVYAVYIVSRLLLLYSLQIQCKSKRICYFFLFFIPSLISLKISFTSSVRSAHGNSL